MDKAFMPFARAFEFRGRSTRAEFWWFCVACLFIGIILTLFDSVMAPPGSPLAFGDLGLIHLYALIVFIPSISVSVRRLHDIGRTGWWVLFSLVPIVGPITLIVFWATPGKSNRPAPAALDDDLPQSPTLIDLPSPTASNSSISDRLTALERLGALRERGLLSEIEYASEKARLG